MPDGSSTVIIQGKKPFSLGKCIQTEPYFKSTVLPYENAKLTKKKDENFEALISSIRDLSVQIISFRQIFLLKLHLLLRILKALLSLSILFLPT